MLPLLLCRYFDMVAANQQAAELALELYSDCVRWLLLVGGGYECQVRDASEFRFESPEQTTFTGWR